MDTATMVGSLPVGDFAVIMFVTLVVLSLAAFGAVYVIRHKKKDQAQIHNERIETLNDLSRLQSNFTFQSKTFFSPPHLLPLVGIWREKLRLFSLLSLLLWVISAAVAVAGLATSNLQVLHAGVICFLTAISSFLFCRVLRYSQLKQQSGAITSQNHALLYGYHKTKANYLQILLLVVEFFQLQSYPFRQLINQGSFVTAEGSAIIDVTAQALLLNITGSPMLFLAQFWLAFSSLMVGFLVALALAAYNHRRPANAKMSIYWVSYVLPLVNILFLPILVTFISTMACLLNINTGSSKCANLSVPLYVSLSLVAYMIGYPFLTFFLSSYEKIPKQGEIAFKPISIAVIKSLSLFLIIVLTLIPDNQAGIFVRGFASALVMFLLLIYNIKTSPCYVFEVNFWRSFSFTCVLWTCLIVIFTGTTPAGNGQSILQAMGAFVFLAVAATWILTFVLFFALFQCLRIRRK